MHIAPRGLKCFIIMTSSNPEAIGNPRFDRERYSGGSAFLFGPHAIFHWTLESCSFLPTFCTYFKSIRPTEPHQHMQLRAYLANVLPLQVNLPFMGLKTWNYFLSWDALGKFWTLSIVAWVVACYIGIVGSMQVGTDLGPVLAGHGYLTRCVDLPSPCLSSKTNLFSSTLRLISML